MISIIGKTYHRGQRKEVDVVLRDDIPYMLASSVIPQGMECDELARMFHITLPGYIMGMVEVAETNEASRQRLAALATRIHKDIAAERFQADGVGTEPVSEVRS